MKRRNQYLLAISVFLVGLLIFVVLINVGENQKSVTEKTREVLNCQINCLNEYNEAEKNIPKGWPPEFNEIREDLRNCRDECNKI